MNMPNILMETSYGYSSCRIEDSLMQQVADNLECDVLAKYVEKLLRPHAGGAEAKPDGLTLDFLTANGF